MADSDTPVFLNGHWVLVTPEQVSGSVVQFHVSISVDDPESFNASDVRVDVTAGGNMLTPSEAPPHGPLPTVQTGGITAFAQYTFANPDEATPVVAVVDLGGESSEFTLSEFADA